MASPVSQAPPHPTHTIRHCSRKFLESGIHEKPQRAWVSTNVSLAAAHTQAQPLFFIAGDCSYLCHQLWDHFKGTHQRRMILYSAAGILTLCLFPCGLKAGQPATLHPSFGVTYGFNDPNNQNFTLRLPGLLGTACPQKQSCRNPASQLQHWLCGFTRRCLPSLQQPSAPPSSRCPLPPASPHPFVCFKLSHCRREQLTVANESDRNPRVFILDYGR